MYKYLYITQGGYTWSVIYMHICMFYKLYKLNSQTIAKYYPYSWALFIVCLPIIIHVTISTSQNNITTYTLILKNLYVI